jgi:hypothetical protein
VSAADRDPRLASEWLSRMVEVAPDVFVPKGADGQPSEAVQRERQRPEETEADWIRRVWGFTEKLTREEEGDVVRYVTENGRALLVWPAGMYRWLTGRAR